MDGEALLKRIQRLSQKYPDCVGQLLILLLDRYSAAEIKLLEERAAIAQLLESALIESLDWGTDWRLSARLLHVSSRWTDADELRSSYVALRKRHLADNALADDVVALCRAARRLIANDALLLRSKGSWLQQCCVAYWEVIGEGLQTALSGGSCGTDDADSAIFVDVDDDRRLISASAAASGCHGDRSARNVLLMAQECCQLETAMGAAIFDDPATLSRWRSHFVPFLSELMLALELCTHVEWNPETWERFVEDQDGGLLEQVANVVAALLGSERLAETAGATLKPLRNAYIETVCRRCSEATDHVTKLSRCTAVATVYVALNTMVRLGALLERLRRALDSRTFDSCIRQVSEVRAALRERIESYHKVALTTAILHDAGSNDWLSQQLFYEGERCSFAIQQWHLHMVALEHDLSRFCPKSAAEIYFVIMEDSLRHLAARYCSALPSAERLPQWRADVAAILLGAHDLSRTFDGATQPLVSGIDRTCSVLLRALAANRAASEMALLNAGNACCWWRHLDLSAADQLDPAFCDDEAFRALFRTVSERRGGAINVQLFLRRMELRRLSALDLLSEDEPTQEPLLDALEPFLSAACESARLLLAPFAGFSLETLSDVIGSRTDAETLLESAARELIDDVALALLTLVPARFWSLAAALQRRLDSAGCKRRFAVELLEAAFKRRVISTGELAAPFISGAFERSEEFRRAVAERAETPPEPSLDSAAWLRRFSAGKPLRPTAATFNPLLHFKRIGNTGYTFETVWMKRFTSNGEFESMLWSSLECSEQFKVLRADALEYVECSVLYSIQAGIQHGFY